MILEKILSWLMSSKARDTRSDTHAGGAAGDSPPNNTTENSEVKKNFFSCKKIEVPEIRYKCDMELHDRFQNFSSEILKLALAGIAVFGIFLTLLSNKDTHPSVLSAFHSNIFFGLSIFSLIFLGFSVICALMHRFLASDGMFYHLRAIKYLILLENQDPQVLSQKDDPMKLIIKDNEMKRTDKLRKSEKWLKASASFLALGSIILGLTFLFVFQFTNTN